MDRKKFSQFLHGSFGMSDEIIMDRIFKFFNIRANDDIDEEEWILGFNTLLRGSQEELTQYCFNIFDLTNDGWVSGCVHWTNIPKSKSVNYMMVV